MYIKKFDDWIIVKKYVEHDERSKVALRKGEIRWASVGVNVGSEIDGKGESFTRPVLILKVIGSNLCLIAPLSTKLKEIPGYISFEYKDKTVSVCANQIRTISQKRIFERDGKLITHKFNLVKKLIFDFIQ